MTCDAGSADFSDIVCPETGVSVRQAAARALIAREELLGETTTDRAASERHDDMIEDVRALTGVLAAEFELAAEDVQGLRDAARWATAAHRATMRSETFALHTAFAMRTYDHGPEPS
ncbi:hypothetical protein GCM10023201_52340 [Actinomycetospora corticicola]|uniref:Uncharacterized protein n=1 Tax=Actinomycetospora corticicola TaxID=663602 RepID=A0A7Y9DY26_9PSEU|nr:hypothetical protein [Actinomycetospora corticicola]NYD37505.1 hypothetical protein [Actinomycetospora corticicola]